MLNIKITDLGKETDGVPRANFVINDIEVPAKYYNSETKNVNFFEPEVIEQFLKSNIAEINKFFNSVFLRKVDSFLDYFIIELGIYPSQNIEEYDFVEFELTTELEHWNKPWSIIEFSTELKNTVTRLDNELIEYYESDEYLLIGFGMRVYIENRDEKISVITDRYMPIFKNVIEKTIESLESAKESLSLSFHFPPETKVACKQYLLYFAQFLADIGIDATTDVRERANKTLFTITPTDNTEALDRIREALAVFLNAPSSKTFDADMSVNRDIAVMQLQSQVHFLKSQIMLAESMLQAKNETIEALKSAKYEVKQLGPVQPKAKSNNKEVIPGTGGIISVGEFTWNGIHVDFAEVVRKLRRRF